jgi:hypothetical protein
LPEPVAQDRHRAIRAPAAPVVVRREGAPGHRTHAEHVEIAAADEQPVHRPQFAARVEVEARAARGEHAGEHVLLIAQEFPLHVGHGLAGARLVVVAQHHQAIRLVHRQRLEQQRVHQGEDGDVGADAERQGEQGHAADDRRVAQLPHGESEVAAQRKQQSHGAFDVVAGHVVGWRL